jgi:hypothetical protein
LADANAYSMTAFAKWLSSISMNSTERELMCAVLAMAWLEGGKATLDKVASTL